MEHFSLSSRTKHISFSLNQYEPNTQTHGIEDFNDKNRLPSMSVSWEACTVVICSSHELFYEVKICSVRVRNPKVKEKWLPGFETNIVSKTG